LPCFDEAVTREWKRTLRESSEMPRLLLDKCVIRNGTVVSEWFVTCPPHSFGHDRSSEFRLFSLSNFGQLVLGNQNSKLCNSKDGKVRGGNRKRGPHEDPAGRPRWGLCASSGADFLVVVVVVFRAAQACRYSFNPPIHIWRPGQHPIGQTAKARSDAVCSHSVRDATANVETILNTPRPLSWSKSHPRSNPLRL